MRSWDLFGPVKGHMICTGRHCLQWRNQSTRTHIVNESKIAKLCKIPRCQIVKGLSTRVTVKSTRPPPLHRTEVTSLTHERSSVGARPSSAAPVEQKSHPLTHKRFSVGDGPPRPSPSNRSKAN